MLACRRLSQQLLDLFCGRWFNGPHQQARLAQIKGIKRAPLFQPFPSAPLQREERLPFAGQYHGGRFHVVIFYYRADRLAGSLFLMELSRLEKYVSKRTPRAQILCAFATGVFSIFCLLSSVAALPHCVPRPQDEMLIIEKLRRRNSPG